MSLRFAQPWLLLLLPLPVLLLSLPYLGRTKSGRLRFPYLALLEGLPRSPRVALRPLPDLLRLAALLLVILALARPQSGRVRTQVHGEGVDIAIAGGPHIRGDFEKRSIVVK